MTLGEKIKEYRKSNNISQTVLASSIGVNVSFLCKIEKNEKKISLEKLKSIIQVLEIKSNELENQYFMNKIDELLKDVDLSSKKEILDQLLKLYEDEKRF